ncbi:uncharacterized protein LOC129791279 [Lutzomyia longipalpis]|uniref:uncharacterized protein LOC129791279 n=1 Tax=Lutzomyia longipalpis TaxID=7200 RepID=UPI0024833EB7|nr:uncharacterized protein LOC129791279 [Lutzomyia longipalpis]
MAEGGAEEFDVPEEEVLEILEEEFQQYFTIAFSLMMKLNSPMDRKICKKYLDKCLTLQKPNIPVKINRNKFLANFLEVISESRIFEEENATNGCEGSTKNVPQNVTQWSKDQRTFVAFKELPDTGILIYMANSSEVKPSWGKFDLTSVNVSELSSKITFTD